MNVNPYSPPAAQVSNSLPTASNSELIYAGFWRRFGAYWLDLIVLLPLIGLSFWLGGKMRLFHLYYFVPGLLISLWFHVYLVKKFGGTPGKLLLGLRIARLDGYGVGFREASIRYSILFALSTLASIAMIIATLHMSDSEYLSLGFTARSLRLAQMTPSWYRPVTMLMNVWIWSEFIVMLTNKKRRGLHDFMAGTVVVRAA